MTEILSCKNICDIPNEICLRKSQIAEVVFKINALEDIHANDPESEQLAEEAKAILDSDCRLIGLSRQLGEL